MSDESDLCSVISVEDVEEDEEDISYEGVEGESSKSVSCPSVIWTGNKKKTPVLIFKADAIVEKSLEQRIAGESYHLAFKMVKTECKLVRSVLTTHGFHEAHPNSNDFNLMWTGSHLKPYVLRGLLEFQKVNHFPRSYEVTRKDRLFKNIQKMQQLKGYKHFDFVPQSFVIPSEYQDFCAAAHREKGVWIVKPAASSRGRGIYLVTSPDQVSLDDSVVICRYISNPLLINGFKFDVRLYVAVTSFDPLLIYLYEEGLTRFATIKFDKSLRTIRNNCMHLTNYSVNKKSSDYVTNDDADVEDYGNKWSLGALLRYLRSHGFNTTALMMSIEDVIVKTLISVELPIASACKMFQPYRGNCFELFGFDILLDDNLRPWVLEVNLSPSLACDAPLDMKIKSNMVADLFSLVGFECHDPMTRKMPMDGYWNPRMRPSFRAQSAKLRPKTSLLSRRRRPDSAYFVATKLLSRNGDTTNASQQNLTSEESRILQRTREEYARRGGWVRVFPTPDTWDTYSSYLLYSTTYNVLLHNNLFRDGLSNTTMDQKSSNRHRIVHLHSIPNAQLASGLQNNLALVRGMERSKQYERKLICLGQNPRRRRNISSSSSANNPSAVNKITLVQGTAEEVFSATHQKEGQTTKSLSLPNGKEPMMDVIKLLESGMTISKAQARFAFSTYLKCIRNRLKNETENGEETNSESANEQMDLVLRFLQRAANNLQQPFKIVVPSAKLSINVRRQMLSKQLHEFIGIYDRETEEMKQNTAADLRLTSKSNLLQENEFHNFVVNASENELEEVLTVFTKISKSASIFLRSYSRSSSEQLTSQQKTTNSGLPKRRDSHENSKNSSPQKPTGQDSNNMNFDSSPVAGSNHSQASHSLLGSRPGIASSSFANAVAVYSAKTLGSYPNVKHRPISAISQKSAGNSVIQKVRPLSAVNNRESSATNAHSASATEVVLKQNLKHNKALQQLTVKQKPIRHQDDDFLYASNAASNSQPIIKDKHSSKNGLYRRVKHSNNENIDGSEKVDEKMDDEDSCYPEVKKIAASENAGQIMGSIVDVESTTYNQRHSRNSPSFDSANYFQTQQSMIEQSRALLEESKAKHHALVAQAHNIQKQLASDEYYHRVNKDPETTFMPKPPSKPQNNDKKTSSHRSVRIARTTSPEEPLHSNDFTSDVEN